MFDRVLVQIQQYESLNQDNTVYEVVGLVITRLYQVDKVQLQSIPAATLQKLCSLLLKYQSDKEKIHSLIVYCDQALSTVERYRSHHPTELVDSAK